MEEKEQENIIDNIKENTQQKKEKFLLKVLPVIFVLLIAIACIPLFLLNNHSSYKSIDSTFGKYFNEKIGDIEFADDKEKLLEKYTLGELLKLSSTELSDLNEIIFNEVYSKEAKSKIFKTFYQNQLVLNKLIADKFYDFDLSDYGTIDLEELCQYIYGGLFGYQNVSFQGGYFENGDAFLISVNPENNLIKIVYGGEGSLSSVLNNEFLYDSYRQYLTNDWIEFLKVESKYSPTAFYEYGGDSLSMLDKAKYIIELENFKKRFPRFNFSKYVKRKIADRVYGLLFNQNMPVETINKEIEEGVKFYLSNGDKKTEYYLKTKKRYEELKNNTSDDISN